ncbi:MAG: LptF/LptG family permease [Bacteroidota bacterium]
MYLRKLDVLMLKSFVGPFILTTGVATFILLIQYLLKYFDDLVGKNLGFSVFGELLFYFSLNMLQNAIPLGVLVASLMTFGNLGEHFELTAIKSAGISLVRTLRPIFLLVCLVSIGVFFFNNNIIPAANLKAYSLLYDIKQTKPALDIKAGAFYNGIPDYSIKVKEKFPDGKTVKDIIIYDHTEGRGNKTVILADSSLMYTIMDERYLKLELFDGHYYSEKAKSGNHVDEFYRTEFEKMDLVFNLASFDLKRRNEELFQNNRQMKNLTELTNDVDSFKNEMVKQRSSFILNTQRYFNYHLQNKRKILKENQPLKKDSISLDSTNQPYQKKYVQSATMFPWNLVLLIIKQNPKDTVKKDLQSKQIIESEEEIVLKDRPIKANSIQLADSLKKDSNAYKKLILAEIDLDTLTSHHLRKYLTERKIKEKMIFNNALSRARNIKVNLSSTKSRVYNLQKNVNLYTLERDKKYAMSLACIIMFMIGAPLGAIIKKGGLGVPVIIAILFFIIYYIIGSIGKQQTKELQMDPYTSAWMANAMLFPFGLFFLRQARIDARLFDIDIYNIWIEKLRARFARKAK